MHLKVEGASFRGLTGIPFLKYKFKLFAQCGKYLNHRNEENQLCFMQTIKRANQSQMVSDETDNFKLEANICLSQRSAGSIITFSYFY